MTYVYQLYDPNSRKNVDLRLHKKEIKEAIRKVFNNIKIKVDQDSIEIDFPNPPYHIELTEMSQALMETPLGVHAVEKDLHKTIKGSKFKTRNGTKAISYVLYDDNCRNTIDLTEYHDDILKCVQNINPDTKVKIYSNSFIVSNLSRGECNALGRAIAKSSLKAFTVSVPYIRLIKRVKDDDGGEE